MCKVVFVLILHCYLWFYSFLCLLRKIFFSDNCILLFRNRKRVNLSVLTDCFLALFQRDPASNVKG